MKIWMAVPTGAAIPLRCTMTNPRSEAFTIGFEDGRFGRHYKSWLYAEKHHYKAGYNVGKTLRLKEKHMGQSVGHGFKNNRDRDLYRSGYRVGVKGKFPVRTENMNNTDLQSIARGWMSGYAEWVTNCAIHNDSSVAYKHGYDAARRHEAMNREHAMNEDYVRGFREGNIRLLFDQDTYPERDWGDFLSGYKCGAGCDGYTRECLNPAFRSGYLHGQVARQPKQSCLLKDMKMQPYAIEYIHEYTVDPATCRPGIYLCQYKTTREITHLVLIPPDDVQDCCNSRVMIPLQDPGKTWKLDSGNFLLFVPTGKAILNFKGV